MYALGTWYFHGEYFKKDIKKGFVLMLEAADLNFSDACFDVAVAYEKGRGVKKNVNKAFEYYFRALILEDKQAIFEVGRCYFYGIGIPKNKKMADVIITIARNQYGLE
ncbi:MAG: hypothetical protein BGO69_17100 [Bacteroidetes bacterium 46-16]|nr:MAG: hypothetical protein BGO69_17100 [Bacteroidetes bacterium 46-16]